jgi:hypothetical protein
VPLTVIEGLVYWPVIIGIAELLDKSHRKIPRHSHLLFLFSDYLHMIYQDQISAVQTGFLAPKNFYLKCNTGAQIFLE